MLERCDAIRGLAGLAYVSRLAPRTNIAPHRGPTNRRLRCHLEVRVPAGCGLRVEGSAHMGAGPLYGIRRFVRARGRESRQRGAAGAYRRHLAFRPDAREIDLLDGPAPLRQRPDRESHRVLGRTRAPTAAFPSRSLPTPPPALLAVRLRADGRTSSFPRPHVRWNDRLAM